MPHRPRQHQIEDRSRLAFRSRLPSAWVFRDYVPDYGIDGEVEIFDSNGLGTGLRFLVQLKATDNPALKSGLKIRFRQDTFKYYRRLETPILIARYHAPSDRLFVKWFHEFDDYYARRGAKTVTFALASGNEWLSGTADKLVSALKAVRQLKTHNLPVPLTVKLVIEGDPVSGKSAEDLKGEISTAAGRVPRVLRIAPDESVASHATIRVGSSELHVGLSQVKGCTIHVDESYLSGPALKSLSSDLFVALAIALDAGGYPELSARIVSEFGPTSTLIQSPSVAFILANCMARAQRLTEALSIAEGLLISKDGIAAGQVFALAAIARGDVSECEATFIARFWERVIAAVEQTETSLLAASSHYNLGNHLRSRRSFRRAVREYRRAAELDPAYVQRDYFWEELGSAFYLSRRYRSSERAYARALGLRKTGLVKALHADALMFSGRYEEALSAFEQYVANTKDEASGWRLKIWFLRQLVSFLDTKTQQRSSGPAAAIAWCKAGPVSSARLEEALRLDGLCNLAWFNMAVGENLGGDRAAACKHFLMAALCDSSDIEAWSNAAILSMSNVGMHEVFTDVIATAYFVHGELFLKRVTQKLTESLQPAPERFRASLVDTFNQAIKETGSGRSSTPFTLRFLSKEGPGYDSIVVPKQG